MKDIIKELEKLHRACKREESRCTREWMSAVDAELSSLAEVHNTVRHYHMAKKEVLTDVLKMLKELEA